MKIKMSSCLKAAKQTIRLAVKQRLKSMTSEERAEKSKRLCDMFLSLSEYKESKRVCIYLSMKEEVNVFPIMENIFASGKQCFIPQYIGKQMEMLELRDMADFESLPETKWHIKQPAEDDTSRENALETGLDVIVVPGLGFTRDGKRLGRGGGYYDRYLERCRSLPREPKLIALVFSEQICDDIPVGETDRMVHRVLVDDMTEI